MNKRYVIGIVLAGLNPYWIWWLANGLPIEHGAMLALAGVASSATVVIVWLISKI